jgi:hypothetical protein
MIKLLVMKSLQVPCYVVPLRRRYLSQHLVLENSHPSLFLSVAAQVSHPYKTTGKIIVLCILILIILDRKIEGK